jgi:UTP--glucose-1-phosphate uridylyltransferase
MHGKQMITKAVFPVAGLGTRFLPATKANPKEMLPIVDKPLIQYAVEEAIKAGITELIFVTSSTKRAIEDHFDTHFELEHRLKSTQKNDLLNLVQNIVPEGVNCVYVRQPQALGLGHAVLCAEKVVGNEPFAVLLADDLIDASPCCLSQMVNLYNETQQSVVAVQHIEPEESRKYGVIAIDSKWRSGDSIENIVEKPAPSLAPSNWGVVGRYVLSAEVFTKLKELSPGSGGEIQLTDAIQKLIPSYGVRAWSFDGVRYDCGSKLGYLKATIAFGLKHPEVMSDFRTYLQEVANTPEEITAI